MCDREIIYSVFISWYVAIFIGLLNSFLMCFISQDLSQDDYMLIDDSKLRLLFLFILNIIVILAFRHWVLSKDTFVWLLNGLPS